MHLPNMLCFSGSKYDLVSVKHVGRSNPERDLQCPLEDTHFTFRLLQLKVYTRQVSSAYSIFSEMAICALLFEYFCPG